jgi:hypothetical protein
VNRPHAPAGNAGDSACPQSVTRAPDAPEGARSSRAMGARGHPTALTLLLLTLLALAVRLVFFERFRWEGVECDGAAYLDLARHIGAGQGWLVDYVQLLFRPVVPLPRPDAQWSPLYPLLTAFAISAGGLNVTAAKIVPLFFGVLVPPATCLLCLGLTGSRTAGACAGLFSLAYPALVMYSLRIQAESGTILLVTAVFSCLLLRPRAAWLLGTLMGLAFLMKCQSMWLWPGVALGLCLTLPRREALRALLITTAVFLLVCSPWMVRNARVFGNPLHSDLTCFVLADYPEFGGGQCFVASAVPPPRFLEYAASRPMEVARHVWRGLRGLRGGLFRDNRGSLFLVPLAVLGLWSLRLRWRLWLPIALYGVALSVFVSLSLPAVRYLLNLIPFWASLAGAGAARLLRAPAERDSRLRALSAVVAGALVAGAVLGEARETVRRVGDRRSDWNPGAYVCPIQLLVCRPYLLAHTAPREPVFVCEVYHGGLLLDRPAINVPFDGALLQRLRGRYGIRYMAISTLDLRRRLASWEAQPPPWARVVARISPDSIRRVFPSALDMEPSEMRIYRLSASGR